MTESEPEHNTEERCLEQTEKERFQIEETRQEFERQTIKNLFKEMRPFIKEELLFQCSQDDQGIRLTHSACLRANMTAVEEELLAETGRFRIYDLNITGPFRYIVHLRHRIEELNTKLDTQQMKLNALDPITNEQPTDFATNMHYKQQETLNKEPTSTSSKMDILAEASREELLNRLKDLEEQTKNSLYQASESQAARSQALQDLERITAELSNTQKKYGDAMMEVHNTKHELKNKLAKIQGLLAERDNAISRANQAKEDLEKAKKEVEKADNEKEEALEKINELTARLDGALEKMRENRQAGEEIPELFQGERSKISFYVSELDKALTKTKQLTADLKKTTQERDDAIHRIGQLTEELSSTVFRLTKEKNDALYAIEKAAQKHYRKPEDSHGEFKRQRTQTPAYD